MTQKDEALKMAIEALEKAEHQMQSDMGIDVIEIALNSCKAALSEPEQVSLPDGWVAVDKEIPADGVYVIAAYIKDGEIWNWDKLRYSSTAKKWYSGNKPMGVDYNYWMPLPSAPRLNTKD